MRTFAAAIAFTVAALLASPATARADEAASRQASKHFLRGVALYGEADYRAALVEFKRAYAVLPNPAVLYNVGETQYQLQDYAGALTTFEHFLAEASSGDGHRAEVEGDLEILRARVGHMAVTTIPSGADLAIDDQPVGRTPLDKSLLVSIGHRKVVASLAGRPAITRYVDVAADDSVSVTLQLPDAAEPAPAPPLRVEPASRATEPASASHGGGTLRWVGWATTGALAAGAITSGILGLHESHDLEAARASFPVSSQTLNRDAQLTTTFSVVADSLAAAAVVVGGLTLLSGWLSPSTGTPTRGSSGTTRVVLGPASARLVMTF
ncbi:MAG TPA: PEGA domain-containing protein [Polyangiaceae bacterium]|jgi:hypothetical protein|nr:PEGA domain-containing protein [Polyangiaceae bacterium]